MLIPKLEQKIHVEVDVWRNGRPVYDSNGKPVKRVVEAFVHGEYSEELPLEHQDNQAFVLGRLKLKMELPDRAWTDLERFKLARIAEELGVENPLENRNG